MVEGKSNPDFYRKKIPFGAYAMVYTGTTNKISSRSTAYIYLGESNQHDGQYFMFFTTDKRIHSRKWVQFPISDEDDQTMLDDGEEEMDAEEEIVQHDDVPNQQHTYDPLGLIMDDGNSVDEDEPVDHDDNRHIYMDWMK